MKIAAVRLLIGLWGWVGWASAHWLFAKMTLWPLEKQDRTPGREQWGRDRGTCGAAASLVLLRSELWLVAVSVTSYNGLQHRILRGGRWVNARQRHNTWDVRGRRVKVEGPYVQERVHFHEDVHVHDPRGRALFPIFNLCWQMKNSDQNLVRSKYHIQFAAETTFQFSILMNLLIHAPNIACSNSSLVRICFSLSNVKQSQMFYINTNTFCTWTMNQSIGNGPPHRWHLQVGCFVQPTAQTQTY